MLAADNQAVPSRAGIVDPTPKAGHRSKQDPHPAWAGSIAIAAESEIFMMENSRGKPLAVVRDQS